MPLNFGGKTWYKLVDLVQNENELALFSKVKPDQALESLKFHPTAPKDSNTYHFRHHK